MSTENLSTALPRLSREMILGDDAPARRLAREEVALPTWGGTVLVREMTSGEQTQFKRLFALDAEGKLPEGRKDLNARIVCLCTINDDGSRIFADTDEKLVSSLGLMAVDKLTKAIMRLSGLSEEARADAEKN